MSPVLRSNSTPTTPTGRSNPQRLPTPKSSSRKTHQCRTCGRPRIGHPRSGCPWGDAPSSAPMADNRIPAELTAALSTLSIEHFADAKSSALRRRSGPIEADAMHGDTESDTDEDAQAPLRKWREAVSAPVKKREELMPGTLVTPNSSMFATEPASDHEDADAFHGAKTDVEDEDFIPTPHASQGLIRSLSMEERSAFLDGLAEISKAPPATVYIVPMADLPMLQASAKKVGFCTRAVPPVNGSEEDDGLFIIGRDDTAVERLHGELSKDLKKKRRISAVQLAGGAMMGAVATFGTLAFS